MAALRSKAGQATSWRYEVLEVLYWLRGEGFEQRVDAASLERFLGLRRAEGQTLLDQLVEEGLLARAGDAYTLSETSPHCPICAPSAEWGLHVP